MNINFSLIKHSFIIILSLFFISFTTFLSVRYVKRNKVPVPNLFEPGYQYIDFVPYLKNVKRLGFLSNKSISAEAGLDEFQQAQYMLVPAVLDLNNSNYEYNVLDFMTEKKDQFYLFYMLKKLNAEKVADNSWGRVLIRRKP
jgi:hypothetical protein